MVKVIIQEAVSAAAPTKYTYHKDMTAPQNGEIFVFGSNLSGAHGGGAAREAYKTYGAKMGKSIGLVGRSYAIPTKGKMEEDLPSLDLKEIKKYVKDFKAFARENKNLTFFITRIGCVLAGYSNAEIAPMFKGCTVRCNFPIEWKKYLE